METRRVRGWRRASRGSAERAAAAGRVRRSLDQEIRFCAASDGVRLAYAKHGRGPPLVKASNWLTHLEFDWESPVWWHWLEELGRRNTVIRYDPRGCGMSDRDVGELSLERWVSDLETVIDAAGVERCSLLGISGGAANALAYSARNPDRVERIVAYGGWASGRFLRADEERREALGAVMRTGWAAPTPAFRRLFTMLFLPDGTPEQMRWYDELQLRSASPEMAVRLYDALGQTDATELLPLVAAPTLVIHARGDLVVPFKEGRRIAAAVPSARLITLDSRNHLLLAHEPAWQVFIGEALEFLGSQPVPTDAVADLSSRERDVMKLVAEGLSNEEIAERLFLSVRTVERHLSNIYVKLRVSGKAARAAAAMRFSQVR
jgi:pimeloyl-ACP methyl ester carboxylesterase/DNA-binding CsgD family transcriptional regulator